MDLTVTGDNVMLGQVERKEEHVIWQL